MANNIAENKNKQEVRRQKAAARERLTNWYMINMTWAFIAVVVLHQVVLNSYRRVFGPWTTHSITTNIVLWSVALLLAIGAGALLYLWKKAGKGRDKFLACSIFAGIFAIVTLLLSFAPQIGASIWGIAGGFATIMNVVMLNIAILFALCGGALFFLWLKRGRGRSRLFSYTIFLWVTALAALILSFHAWIRNVTLSMGIQILSGNSIERIIYGLMIGIGVWLVVALVIYIIKSRKIG